MIYELNPHLSYRIWGGQKLNQYKSIPVDANNDPLGETWEVSTHNDGISKISSSGKNLSEIIKLNYLVKFLDTSDVLSVQVHPNDSYSLMHENQKGKFECWLILEAEKNAGIYLGFKKGIIKKDLERYLLEKKSVDDLLNFYEAKVGDFYVVPPGTIHAIGKGVTLVEVQQSSGVTYRVWDWDRVDSKGIPRELHVKKALDVLEDAEKKNTLDYFQFKKNVFEQLGNFELVKHADFVLQLNNLSKNTSININSENNSIVLLSGKLEINGKVLDSYHAVFVKDEREINIMALENSSFIIIR